MKWAIRRVARIVTGPIGIVPIAFILAMATDAWIESHFIMILPPGHLEFLRGSDDYGCSNLFAGATALYVAFGFLAAWYLTIRLSESEPSPNRLRDLARTMWYLKFHLAAFVLGAIFFSEGGGCDQLYGNDFRNVAALAAVVYLLAISITLLVHRLRWSERARLLAAPAAVVVWLFVGSDGMTPKTWERNRGGHVVFETAGRRQALMRRWYELCERTLGAASARWPSEPATGPDAEK